jgi:D-alanyl-D-alanine carboxypeptidase/D-alanyl-D-alanine-endopeptidase (penicillin-binding protein 4)
VVAVVLAAAGLACLAVAVRSRDASGGASTGTPLGTPLWSARRVPTMVGDAAAAQHLQRALDVDVSSVASSCFVVAEGRQPLAARAPDAALIPASTEKLLIAAAALRILGPEFHYETKVVAATPPGSGAVPKLWLVGAGDSVLATGDYAFYLQGQPVTRGVAVTTRMESLADAVVAQGVRSIPGGVVGDDARYDAQRYVPSWPVSYRTDPEIGPLGALTVNGGYTLVGGRRLTPVADPALSAAETLTRLLQARGVQVGAAAAHGQPPAGAVTVASVSSPPLRDIVTSDLRASNNMTTELLVKELGVRVSGQGTTTAGVRAVKSALQGLGIPTSGLSLVDGSGLDRGNRVSCRTLARVLDLAAQPGFRTILDALPVAGEQGTLAVRLKGTPLEGKLRAKTGTLTGVGGLAGVLDVGRPLRFALLLNGNLTLTQAMDARERFAGILATFPDVAGTALVPAPAAPQQPGR